MTDASIAKNNKIDEHANQSFRFVQLSDLHLSSPQITNPIRLFNKRILGYLSWLRRRRRIHQRQVLEFAIDKILQLNIDHQVITGDLLHIGLKNEFEQCAKWLGQFNPKDITIIPGNHDLYVKEKWSRSFKYWQDYMEGDEKPDWDELNGDDAYEKLTQLYPTVRIRGNVAFICISSIFEAPWFRATGFINHNQLKQLYSLLNEPNLDNYCKILLVHHPVTLTNTKPRKCLINHKELTTLLFESPVNMILHGHEHKTLIEYIDTNSNTKIPVIGIASSSSNSQTKNS
ncbi:MAG: metallophosphoesterase, partial [Pseudomonadota bacterium]